MQDATKSAGKLKGKEPKKRKCEKALGAVIEPWTPVSAQ